MSILSSKRQFPWIFAALSVLSIGLSSIYFRESDKRWQVSLTLLGASAAFVHFLYARHLEETRMFRDLFRDFNKRYDDTNDKLNNIKKRELNTSLSDEDIKVLYDYFNLCGEEYYFFRLGYIPAEVWDSWRKGISIFLKDPAIRKIAKEEFDTESYYGLTIEEIERSY